MDVYKTHDAFSWSELTTSDPAGAAAFHGKLFGWTLQTMDIGEGTGPYQVVKVGETALALSGKTLVPAMDVPGVGRMAVIQDLQGAVLTVMAYSS